MTKPSFVYVTDIVTTPDKLFHALIDPEMTRRYWGNHRNLSDWRVGSAWRHEDCDDATDVDIAGTVLENDPPPNVLPNIWSSVPAAAVAYSPLGTLEDRWLERQRSDDF